MSTLHQCHWHNLRSLHSGLRLMRPGDQLVIYGTVSPAELSDLLADPQLSSVNWYLVKSPTHPNMEDHLIDHADWFQLIMNHHNTVTWKT